MVPAFVMMKTDDHRLAEHRGEESSSAEEPARVEDRISKGVLPSPLDINEQSTT